MVPLILTLLSLWAGARVEVGHYERAMAADLASRLEGTARSVHVKSDLGPEALFGDVHTVTVSASDFSTAGLPFVVEPDRSKRGLIRDLEINLSTFQLRGLAVQSLRASIPNCRFDLTYALGHKKLRLTQSGVGIGEVCITQAGLRDFVLKKFRAIKKAEIKIANGRVSIDGQGQFGPVALGFYLVGRLQPVGGNSLNLTDARLLVNGQPIALEATIRFVSKMNPVVDLNRDLDLHNALRIEQVVLREGVLQASGAARIPSKTEFQPPG